MIGPAGLFLFLGLSALLTLVFAIWRHGISAPVPQELQQAFRPLPRTTPVAAALDPRGDDNA
jgi:hypothetical protein